MSWNKLTTSPLKGRKRRFCPHEKLRNPVVIEMQVYQRCKRCLEYILQSPKKDGVVKVNDEHRSILTGF